jgi:hypothetical protein
MSFTHNTKTYDPSNAEFTKQQLLAIKQPHHQQVSIQHSNAHHCAIGLPATWLL